MILLSFILISGNALSSNLQHYPCRFRSEWGSIYSSTKNYFLIPKHAKENLWGEVFGHHPSFLLPATEVVGF